MKYMMLSERCRAQRLFILYDSILQRKAHLRKSVETECRLVLMSDGYGDLGVKAKYFGVSF